MSGPVSIPSVEESYALCRRIARREARNFYYAFLVLPKQQQRSMCALYAFLRKTDDLGDSNEPVEVRREKLAQWREQFHAGLAGDFTDPLLPAMCDTLARHQVPPKYLEAVIDGVEMDFDKRRYATFDELEDYCYHVASVVGLACIHIWGFTSEAALEPARQCGIAFQLTNILRDLEEDARRDRVYLPQEDLDRFDYTVDDLFRGIYDDRFRRLMQFEIERAESHYRAAEPLPEYLNAGGRAAYGTMRGIYHGLLEEIERADGNVFQGRVRLSTWRKLRIAMRHMIPLPWRGRTAVGVQPR